MNDVTPFSYKMTLQPDLEKFIFEGTVEVQVTAKSPVKEVEFHALDLAIWTCQVLMDAEFVTCPFSVDPSVEKLNISLPVEMTGQLTFKIEYLGKISDQMAGFYRSSCVIGGEKKTIAVTQFEESDARRAFPCFDHPAKKAFFDIEMVIDEGLSAISNGSILGEELLPNGRKRIRFHRTPKMSTYLVFFSVGEFEILEDKKDVHIRVAAMPGKVKYGRLGLEFGRKSLEFCEAFFEIPYPLEKLDLIAVPDFAFGAMENWGAITFRENLLLYYAGITSRSGEENIFNVIAHEMVHQWFGNLVTPSDWKYLWLNESFATYLAHVIVNHYYPEWEVMDHFLQTQVGPALERDALRETVPIEIPGGEHVVINSSTAPIIYNKGGSVLEQIEGYLGKDSFKKGLRRYLKNHEYGCAASFHFWDALEAVSEKPITKIMKSWIEQPGFPVLEAGRNETQLIIRQKRFTYLTNHADQTWLVPVSIRLYDSVGGSRNLTILLDDRSATINLDDETVAYKINAGQTGFYRVKYLDRENLEALGNRLQNKELSARDSWGLQNDLYALVKGAQTSMAEYLAFLSYYENEDAALPLTSIADNLHHGCLVMAGNAVEKVTSVGRSIMEKALLKIGFEPQPDEKHITAALRDHLLYNAALFGSKNVIDFGVDQFASLLGGGSVHPDISRSVMQIGALMGKAEAFEGLDERFQSSDSEHERMNILSALGSFRDPEQIERAQHYILNKVPARNRFIPVGAMAANPYAVSSLWDWYISNLGRIEQLHPLHFERIIGAIVPMSGLGREEQVIAFFQDYLGRTSKAGEVIQLSLERLRINSRMRSAEGG